MRRLAVAQRLKRRELAWMLAGFAFVQLALGLVVDRFLPAVRDPEYAVSLALLNAHRAEAPDRPLILAMGSSRTLMGLRPARLGLNSSASPQVYNFAMLACGPMMELTNLRRLVHVGIRPDLALVEITPMFLSQRGGIPVEERRFSSARLNSDELAGLRRYVHGPLQFYWSWGSARCFPCYRHQAELQAALGLDLPAEQDMDRDVSFGWRGYCSPVTPREVEERTQEDLRHYAPALTDPGLAAGPYQAFCDLLTLCRQQRISVVVVMPPESSAFRLLQPEVENVHIGFVQELARDFALPVVDARAWIGDDGFWDGHHLLERGADQYSERFGREVLQPLLAGFRNPPSAEIARNQR